MHTIQGKTAKRTDARKNQPAAITSPKVTASLYNDVRNKTQNRTDIADQKTTVMQTDEVAEKVMSWRKRKRYRLRSHDNNMTFFREPKPTPSGWWPTPEWIQACVDKPRNLKPFKVDPAWVDYRLGDCVKSCDPRACPTSTHHAALAHNATIAGQYYDLACEGSQWHVKNGNETLLDEIIAQRRSEPGFYTPDPNTVVIHLRLGDKMEESNATVFEMLQNSADPGRRSFQGFGALKSLYEFLTSVVQSKAPKVVIRGGSQWPNMYKKSKTYAHCLQEALQEAGYPTEMKLDESNADVDFLYLVHARKIIVTVGGFSRFVGYAVFRRGGILFGRRF